jgi:hypothetical protein
VLCKNYKGLRGAMEILRPGIADGARYRCWRPSSVLLPAGRVLPWLSLQSLGHDFRVNGEPCGRSPLLTSAAHPRENLLTDACDAVLRGHFWDGISFPCDPLKIILPAASL